MKPTSQGDYEAWGHHVCGQHSVWLTSFSEQEEIVKGSEKSVALEKFEKKAGSVWEGIHSGSAWAATWVLGGSDTRCPSLLGVFNGLSRFSPTSAPAPARHPHGSAVTRAEGPAGLYLPTMTFTA